MPAMPTMYFEKIYIRGKSEVDKNTNKAFQ